MRCQHPRNLKDFQPKTSPAVLVISERLEAGKQVLISINLPSQKGAFSYSLCPNIPFPNMWGLHWKGLFLKRMEGQSKNSSTTLEIFCRNIT